METLKKPREFPLITKGFLIYKDGDHSVGDPDENIEVMHDDVFEFFTEKELIYFVRDLYRTFTEYFTRGIKIYISEELSAIDEGNFYAIDLVKYYKIA